MWESRKFNTLILCMKSNKNAQTFASPKPKTPMLRTSSSSNDLDGHLAEWGKRRQETPRRDDFTGLDQTEGEIAKVLNFVVVGSVSLLIPTCTFASLNAAQNRHCCFITAAQCERAKVEAQGEWRKSCCGEKLFYEKDSEVAIWPEFSSPSC